jgi:hypothetical protein
MSAPEYTLEIKRGDTRPLAFAFKTGVKAEPAPLAGSDFTLKLFDATGVEILEKAGANLEGQARFDITLEERAALKPGRNGRWALYRTIGGQQELWAQGNTYITGAA